MRIGLNLLHALPEIGGGWNYMESLLAALGEHAGSAHSFVAFATSHSLSLVPNRTNFKTVVVGVQSASRVQRVLFENTVLPRLALRNHLDCLHWFANVQGIVNTVPAAVTVYDLQPYQGHASYSWMKRLFLRTMLAQTVRHAPVLLPMSQATADQLRQRLQADPARMVVIPPVLASQFRPAAADRINEFRAEYGLPHDFWLYVAHFYSHKNHVRLLKAYQRLKDAGAHPWPLVLRGNERDGTEAMRQALTQLKLTGDVIFLPQLSASQVPILYSAASGLIFPSLYEGAGIPIIEAMACGCPVVGSDIPAVREFAAEAALYFDPMDVGAISQAMHQLQSNPERRGHYQQLGLARTMYFDAVSVVGHLLAAYEQATRSRK